MTPELHDRIRAVRPGAPSLDLGLPRRTDHRLDPDAAPGVPGFHGFPRMLIAAAIAAFCTWYSWAGLPPAARAAALAVLLALCRGATAPAAARTRLLAVTCLGVHAARSLVHPWIWAPGSRPALSGARSLLVAGAIGLSARPGAPDAGSSVGATLATAPITAGAFGTVSLAGIVLNFVAIPLAAVAVPGVLREPSGGPALASLAAVLAAGSGLALEGLDLLARVGRFRPGACVWQPGRVALGLAVDRGPRRWAWGMLGRHHGR